MSKPILIGVVGKARSGKDTAADYLAERLGLYKYAFAEPLKTMLKSVFGDHFHEGDRSGICPETGVSYRKMMQTLGTEWGRGLNPDIWVNLVDRKWREVINQPVAREHLGLPVAGMVLSDLRLDSEAEWILQNGGVLVEIIRPGTETKAPWWKFWHKVHESEQGLNADYPRYTIRNDRDIRRLQQELESFIVRRVR